MVLMQVFGLLSMLIAQSTNQLSQRQSNNTDDLKSIVEDHKAQWMSIAERIKDLEEVIQTQKDLSNRLQSLAETTKLGIHQRSSRRQPPTLGIEKNRMYPWAEQPGAFRLEANCTHAGGHNLALNFSFGVSILHLQ